MPRSDHLYMKPTAAFHIAVPESIKNLDDVTEIARAVWAAVKWMWSWNYILVDFRIDREASPALRRNGKIIAVFLGMTL